VLVEGEVDRLESENESSVSESEDLSDDCFSEVKSVGEGLR